MEKNWDTEIATSIANANDYLQNIFKFQLNFIQIFTTMYVISVYDTCIPT